MNFISAFEELNKLYEEKTKVVPTLKKTTVKSGEAAIEEACTKEDLTEAADDDVIEIMDDEPIEEPSVEEEAVEDESIDEPEVETQFVLECVKCGALIVRAEGDIAINEESDVIVLQDPCEYCESTEGHKIIGTMLPYEKAEEPVEAEIIEEEPVEDEAAEEPVKDAE